MHDVIVVGAGLSGLSCARRLAAGGARVRVVEARTRVGGRLETGVVGGERVDLGGQWLTTGQDRLVALARELGVAAVEHDRVGRPVLAEDARGYLARVRGAIAQWLAMRRIERMAARVPAGDPAAAEDAARLDRKTFGELLAEIGNDIARDRIRLHADLVFATEPEALSLLAYLATMGATGGFVPEGGELPGGGREQRFVDGAQELAVRMAGALDVRLGEPIAAIDDRGDHVRARGPGGEHAARRLVLAIPPALVRGIAVALSDSQRRYVDAVRAGPVVKCFAAYPRPFWREAGLSGEGYRVRGSVRATVAHGSVLCAFVVGAPAAAWAARRHAERRAEVIATLVDQFGEDAGSPIDYREADWAADPWSAGCVAGTGPDVLARGARWRQPHGRIHIAGTESAVAWPGYMEGAVEAGERAAAEVLAAG